MLSHGIVSAALFLVVGVVYDRIHSREIAHYGGLVNRMPIYAFTFMIFMLASVGLPGTAGFVGEILVLVGVYQVNTWVAALAALGLRSVCAADIHSLSSGSCLYLIGGPDAGGYEETDRLFLSGAYGFCYHWYFFIN